jgi:hypothetical protein
MGVARASRRFPLRAGVCERRSASDVAPAVGGRIPLTCRIQLRLSLVVSLYLVGPIHSGGMQVEEADAAGCFPFSERKRNASSNTFLVALQKDSFSNEHRHPHDNEAESFCGLTN